MNRLCRLAALVSIFHLPAAAADPVSLFANSDENYVALRTATLTESFAIQDLTLERDLATLRLNGQVAFSGPVLGDVVLGVFTGQGEFIFEPSIESEQRSLQLHIEQNSLNEPFESAVFWFTDDTYKEIQAAGQSAAAVAPAATNALERIRGKLRENRERPRSYLEAVLSGEDIDNVEANILADLLNPSAGGAFNAYLHGRKYGDLRYHVRPRGALPQLISPEEVALVNVDPGADAEGIWYLSHFESEYADGSASSGESHANIDAIHYAIETTVEKGKKLDGQAAVTFTALADGERVIKFGLLPELRVSRVEVDGEEIPFIQEHKRRDGSLYAILPSPIRKGDDYTVTIAYRGDEVVRSEGGGNFAVRARASWYPSLGSFTDRATFDLTYHYPKRFQLVSVGSPVGKPEKGKSHSTSHWRSEIPLAVAGFNFGDFSMQERHDDDLDYDIESYATQSPPSFLVSKQGDLPTRGSRVQSAPQAGALSPKRMIEKILNEGHVSMRLYTKYFGPLPYGRIALTQQPSFSSGQSWPALAYLPVSAYLDSTTRWSLLGSATFRFSNFIQEVTPHEVAHQWWGHVVGWASYHDQWLSEGLADFSAGLYVQATSKKPAPYLRFIERWRDSILEKNEFGWRPNDVGPIWMGQRLITRNTSRAYRRLIYPKGGYVIHMLRRMMADPQTGDGLFVKMMHDFVQTHHNQNASTESFKAIVERHMTPAMDLENNGRMDWFFRQWVYGREMPSYDLQYSLTPGADGGTLLKARITQRGVSDAFAMPVPLYVEKDDKLIRLGSINMVGSMTTDPIEIPLPQAPDRVLLNGYLDILADEVTVKTM